MFKPKLPLRRVLNIPKIPNTYMLYEGLNLISIFSDSPMPLLLLLQEKEYGRPKTGQSEK